MNDDGNWRNAVRHWSAIIRRRGIAVDRVRQRRQIAMGHHWWLAALIGAMVWVGVSTAAWADDQTTLRVVVTEIEDGSDSQVRRELSDIPGLQVETHAWFADEVESRAFHPDRILDQADDLQWVMDGAGIDIIITFEEDSEEDFEVKLITSEDARPERIFLADRGHDGGIRRGGAMVIRYELEHLLDVRPELVTERVEATEAEPADDVEEDEEEEALDPAEVRQRAAEDHEALKERLSRDWLWIRGHARLMQRDFAVAVYAQGDEIDDDVYAFQTGGFPGVELDAEIFPFGRDDPDRQEAGFYLGYNHGFHALNVTDGDTQIGVSVMDLTIEGGALYRLDTPLDENNRQIRLKLGGRYDGFLVSDDLLVPSMSMISAVLGTRLVLPIGVEEFAITSSADVMPLAFFGTNEEVFGGDSFSWGFGAELGAVYQVMSSGFASVGYGFRFVRSYFDDAGDPIETDPNMPDDVAEHVFSDTFINSEFYDFSHGLRVGFVFQY